MSDIVERLNDLGGDTLREARSEIIRLRAELAQRDARIAELEEIIANQTVTALGARVVKLEAALREREWRTIESAPRDGTRFLAMCPDGEIGIVSRHDPGGETRNPRHHYECWVTDFNSNKGLPPSHWQPLPSPAAADTED
jgi:hypothetical protein